MRRLGRANNQSGFTLIEIIIAAGTISLTVVAVLGTFNTIEILNRRARNLTIATQVLQQQMEIYRNTSYLALPAGGAVVDISSLMTPHPSLGTPPQRHLHGHRCHTWQR